MQELGEDFLNRKQKVIKNKMLLNLNSLKLKTSVNQKRPVDNIRANSEWEDICSSDIEQENSYPELIKNSY